MNRKEMKFTAAERRTIEAGWHVLQGFAERSHSDDYALRQALRKEMCAFSERLPKIQAKALIIGWFLDGASDPDKPARYLFACREAAIWATSWGCALSHSKAVTDAQVDSLAAAKNTYKDVFQRYLDANKGE